MGLNEYVQIGSRIKKQRMTNGIKQNEMAKKLGIPISTYANYENDHREPTSEILDQIASILQTTVSKLIGYEDLDTFTSFLESMGYQIKSEIDEVIESHQEDMIHDGKLIGKKDVIDKATYKITIIHGDQQTIFSEQEFEDFQNAIRNSIEFQLWLKNK